MTDTPTRPRWSAIHGPDSHQFMLLRDAEPVEPGEVLRLLDRLNAAERERDALRRIVEAYDSDVDGALAHAIRDAFTLLRETEG